MNPTTQPGMHPDAELLTAFAERVATDAERQEILAHMAVCGRCREVVFLAQKAMEGEEPARTMSQVSDRRIGVSWFTGWRWSWIPVAALAGVVGFAVFEHMRHASIPETRMAQNAAPPEMVQGTAVSKAVATPKGSQQPSRAESREKVQAGVRSDRDTELARKSLDDKDKFVAQKKDESAKEADSLSGVAPSVSGGIVHGTIGARATSSGVGGPMAQNQMQAQNNTQLQQNYANEAGRAGALSDSANKPMSPTIQPGTASQTVTVEAVGGPVHVSPSPSAAPEVSAMQLDTESEGPIEQKLAKAKSLRPALPSKLGVLSEAAAGRRVIALDTAGSLFRSEDAGKHWQAVNAAWTGRPVLVKTRPAAVAGGGSLKEPTPQFELTTDKQETWVSADGKTWILEPPAAK